MYVDPIWVMSALEMKLDLIFCLLSKSQEGDKDENDDGEGDEDDDQEDVSSFSHSADP